MTTATYSPEDNKLRLYVPPRLPREVYDRVRAAGFIWAPKQELFVAPVWTPEREDLLTELCGDACPPGRTTCADFCAGMGERAEHPPVVFPGNQDIPWEDERRERMMSA
jgi:hypothetical protein